jgi:hypothetical protein
MTEVYIIRNQHQLYLDKQGNWVDGSESHQLYRTHHKDEAINTKVELSVRHPELRLTVVPGALDARGQVCLTPAESAIDPAAKASFTVDDSAAKPETTDQSETCA